MFGFKKDFTFTNGKKTNNIKSRSNYKKKKEQIRRIRPTDLTRTRLFRFEVARVNHSTNMHSHADFIYNLVYSGTPDFSNLLGKSKLVQIIEVFEKSGVKLQCLTVEGKSLSVRIIGSFEKPRVREIGILL